MWLDMKLFFGQIWKDLSSLGSISYLHNMSYEIEMFCKALSSIIVYAIMLLTINNIRCKLFVFPLTNEKLQMVLETLNNIFA